MARYVERMLPCQLTESEIREKIKQMRGKLDEQREIDFREKKYKNEIKDARSLVEPDIGILSREISEESENRSVKCQLVYDTQKLEVTTIRMDTFAQVGKARRMNEDEIEEFCQVDFTKDAAGEAAAEGVEGDLDFDIADDELPEDDREGSGESDDWLRDGEAAAGQGAQEGEGDPEAPIPGETDDSGQEPGAATFIATNLEGQAPTVETFPLEAEESSPVKG